MYQIPGAFILPTPGVSMQVPGAFVLVAEAPPTVSLPTLSGASFAGRVPSVSLSY